LIARLAQAAVDAFALTPLRNATVLSLVFVAFSSFVVREEFPSR
jgi:AmiR/NasT family two-component response regulator